MATGESIKQASIGFDLVFSNDLDGANAYLSSGDSPFHLMGRGCVVFLQAALGMEAGMMNEASRLLTLAEAKAKKEVKLAKNGAKTHRFATGLDFEVLQADAILLLGLTQALSESYTGYLQCMYSLNSAHTKFTKIYRTVFPDGINKSVISSFVPVSDDKPSTHQISKLSTTLSTTLEISATAPQSSSRPGLFSRWSSSSIKSSSRSQTPVSTDDRVEEFIVAGATFGYGLFNLVLSLLPAKVKGVVGFFGYESDRKVALQALAVAAAKDDVHAVFAGLTLMSYHGMVLLLSGYQADETNILTQYRAIVDRLKVKYPSGSLWCLHSAKILRMSYDPDGAIAVLQAGLVPERPHSFAQADTLLVFELAWTLLAQRRYQESADMFMKLTKLNTWSHATYCFTALGCYISIGNMSEAKAIASLLPDLLDKRKIGGRELPTEVFIRKKVAFYKEKHICRGCLESDYVSCIRISVAEELGLFWNVHDRMTISAAETRIREWLSLSPPVTVDTPYAGSPKSGEAGHPDDLDTPDELALRSLLLGVAHRSLSHFPEARAFLQDVSTHKAASKWINALTLFELAVLGLKETEALDKAAFPQTYEHSKTAWKVALKDAAHMLDGASDLSANSELPPRLDSRISFLREEMALKQRQVFGGV